MKQNTPIGNILLILLCALTILLTIAWGLCRPAGNGLRGEYYGNADWDDAPVMTVVDAVPSTDTLKNQRSRLGQQPVSVEWNGYVNIPVAGLYTFFTNSDDGSFLSIDDVLVVDNGGTHGSQERQGAIFLWPGFHQIRIRYFDIGGYAVIRVFWQSAGTEKTRLPSHVLIPPISITRLWSSQNMIVISPVIAALWGIALVSCLFTSHRCLRRRPYSRYAVAAVWSPDSLRALLSHTLQRLFGLPLLFVKQQLTQACVWYWILIALYTALIFFTLSYARTFSTLVINRYGDGMFSSITLVTLVTAGCVVIAYMCALREKLFSRLAAFAAIGGLYAYVLIPGFRDALHEWTVHIGYTGEFLTSLRIYPLVNSEKIHFLEYGLLGLLLCKALSFHIKDKLAYPLAVVGVYCIGLLDEGVQWALPNRVGEFRDIGINLLAGTLTVILVALVLRPRVFRTYAR